MHIKRKWLKFSICILCISLVCLVLFIAFNREYINGAFVEYSDLKEVRPNIFVSPDLDKKTVDSLLYVVQQAKLRNESFWMDSVELPKIIYCSSHKMAEEYIMTDGTLAESIFTVFSRHIVVNVTGLTVDILSHELAHVVLFDRLTHFKWGIITYKVPVWFDEGLAMQVDDRQTYTYERFLKYTNGGKDAPKLSSLNGSNFFRVDSAWYNYATSKYEVNRWLKKAGKEGLKGLINSTNVFSDFEEKYKLLERSIEEQSASLAP